MTTVRDVITDSMKELGAIAIAEVPSDAEAQDALGVLNNLIGTWRTESLMPVGMDVNVYVFPFQAASYTIGVGGDINTPRPNSICSAYVRDTNNNDYQMLVTTDYQVYSDIVTKTVSSTIPVVMYYNPGFPLGTMFIWPEPSDQSYRLVLWTWSILDTYTTINDVISLAPGYQRAITSNLAIDLAARYGKTPMPTLIEQAKTSKAQLKRYNNTVSQMTFDRGVSNGNFSFNYLTGQPH